VTNPYILFVIFAIIGFVLLWIDHVDLLEYGRRRPVTPRRIIWVLLIALGAALIVSDR
jgi:hypothetical protein